MTGHNRIPTKRGIGRGQWLALAGILVCIILVCIVENF